MTCWSAQFVYPEVPVQAGCRSVTKFLGLIRENLAGTGKAADPCLENGCRHRICRFIFERDELRQFTESNCKNKYIFMALGGRAAYYDEIRMNSKIGGVGGREGPRWFPPILHARRVLPLLTHVTMFNVIRNIPLHSRPPIALPKPVQRIVYPFVSREAASMCRSHHLELHGSRRYESFAFPPPRIRESYIQQIVFH